MAAACFAALAACEPIYEYRNAYLEAFATPNPVPENFFFCHGYGCKIRERVSLSAAEWETVRAKFRPPAEDADAERRQIARAVALAEYLAGVRFGTWRHQNRGFSEGIPTEIDCIDESVNTYTFLTMFERDGLLRYYRDGGLAHGGSLLGWDVRNTAVLVAKADGERFAIDPTQTDPGFPPPIFPLTIWLGDWPPEIPAKYLVDDELPEGY